MATRRSSLRLPWSQDESPTQSSTRPNATTTITTTSTTLTGETQIPFPPSNINSTATNSLSQTTTRPKIGQRPPFRPAPSPKNRASRNKSQSSSPPQATNKSRIASPSTKSRLSQSPSSSRLTPQSSSPARKTPQVLSTKASQDSVVKTQMQERNQTLQHVSSISTKAQTPILDKKEPTEQMELQTKKLTMSDAVSEAKVSFTDKTMQPLEVSVLKSTSNTGESSKLLKESTSNIQEIKEVVHEAIGKEYGAGEQVQQKQAYMVKQEEATKDQNLVNPASYSRDDSVVVSKKRNH